MVLLQRNVFQVMRVIHIGTDEVYGNAPAGLSFTEEANPDPRSPYAASKVSTKHLVITCANSYAVSSVIPRCTNNFGTFQCAGSVWFAHISAGGAVTQSLA